MPRFQNRTVAVAVNRLSPDDDEDNDICPVCDGDCTCDNRPRLLLPPDVNHGNACFVATPTASTASSGRAVGAQPLKIKLTVPPSIQNRARSLISAKKSRAEDSSAASNGVAGSNSVQPHLTSASSIAGHGHHSASDTRRPKCNRSLKAVATARDVVPDRKNRGNEASMLPQSQSHLSSRTHAQRSVTSRATRPRVETSKSNLAASRQTSKSQAKGTIAKRSASIKKQAIISNFTDSDRQPGDTLHDDDDDDDDACSSRFPTFVSADGLTLEASDSSDYDSDTSGFGSDSSLAAEEESYILAEQRRHEKARIRRELLGDDAPKHKELNNNWVIRPRKRSVGLSDVDMEGDTDVSEGEDEDEDEEMEDDEDEDEDEPDGQASRVYTGLATGWSDDEESSFDADLFFANLTDASSDDGSSDSDGSHPHDSTTEPLVNSVARLRNADFEVTEAWDGQLVFTNGANDGQGVLDLAFEANAAQLLASDSASMSHDSDVEMGATDGAGSDTGEGDSELVASDGDTTEEEFVDEQGLPTSRAMKLFRWPTSVSSINPMSTVSPNVSPVRLSRRHPPPTVLGSPRPADILAGKVFWEETGLSKHDSAEVSVGESPRSVVGCGVPIMGQFSMEGNTPQKTAIITGANKGVPSPYPCRRRRFSSSAGSFSSMDLRGRTARLSIYPSLPPPSDEPSSEALPDNGLGEPIKLDDVLDSTFLSSEPEMEMSTVPHSEGEQKLPQSLSRWDRVPVDTFRLIRETVASAADVPTSHGWVSEPAKSAVPETRSYQNALKSSPLHTMLWNDKSRIMEYPRKSGGVNISPVLSPVLLPVRDGDRTPPHVLHHDLYTNQRQQHTPFKNRKESRREMKMVKRKTHGPSRQYDHHQRHQRRNHHPNMKSRGNASVQRTFFNSPTSAPALNI